MMDNVIQLKQHDDDRQDKQEYSMPDSIPKNIASVPKPSKDDVVHAHIKWFHPRTTNTTILHKHSKKLMNTNLNVDTFIIIIIFETFIHVVQFKKFIM